MVLWKTELDEAVGRHEIPSQNQNWGYFDPTAESWQYRYLGGDGLHTIIHELGHGLGLAHPHDGGAEDDRTTFPGVADPYSTGTYGLNQGVWTVMSYNTGWDEAGSNLAYGNQGGLGAFDIAALQALYGANHATGAGDNTYDLPTGTTGWSCLWDAGGTDTIAAAPGSAGSTIDLRAATLREGDPNAGGFVSSRGLRRRRLHDRKRGDHRKRDRGGRSRRSERQRSRQYASGQGRQGHPVGRRRQRCAPRRLGSGHFRVRYEAEQAHEQGL